MIMKELENLPRAIAEEIKKRPQECELIKLAQKLLDRGDKENAAKVLDVVFVG